MTAFRFFSFSNAGGFTWHDSIDAAKAEAESALDSERENAADDGWMEDDATSICYGEIKGQVVETARMPWHEHLAQQGTAEEDMPERMRFDEFVDFDLKEIQ